MIGVDIDGRALLRVRLQHPVSSAKMELDAWIDTGFPGELEIPLQTLVSLGLPLGTAVPAQLADGSLIRLDSYTGLLDWFGQWRTVEIIANQGQFPLLGVGLLMDRELRIDYPSKTLSVQ